MFASPVMTIQTTRSACGVTRSAGTHFLSPTSVEPTPSWLSKARRSRLWRLPPDRPHLPLMGRGDADVRPSLGCSGGKFTERRTSWRGHTRCPRRWVTTPAAAGAVRRPVSRPIAPGCRGARKGADGLAHRPGSVRRDASRRPGWRPSISGCRCRHPPATYPRARADHPRTLAVWSCSRWGLPSHDGRPSRWWSLAPPFHPYRRPHPKTEAVAVCSLWH